MQTNAVVVDQVFEFVWILLRFLAKINCELGGWGVKIKINFQAKLSAHTRYVVINRHLR